MYEQQTKEYAQNGYTLVRGLIPAAEVRELVAHYMEMNAAEFNIPTPDISDVAAPEMRALYLDLLDRYKRVCSDKSQLFNEMRRRQEAGLRKVLDS